MPVLITSLRGVGHGVKVEKVWEYKQLKTVHLSLELKGRTFQSWGTHTNEMLAHGKACMELVERLHIEKRPKHWVDESGSVAVIDRTNLESFLETSSGCAAHLDLTCAKKAAWAELIERHTLTEICDSELSPNLVLADAFLWAGPHSHWVALVYHQLSDGGFLFASASDLSPQQALRKARQELSPNIRWSQNQANVDHFRAGAVVTGPERVHQYHLGLETLPGFLSKLAPEHRELTEKRLSPIYGEIEVLAPLRRVKGLCVVRAYATEAKALSYTPTVGRGLRYTFVA